MPTQQRRQVGVGDCGLAPRQEADLASHFMRANNVLEADRARDFRQSEFRHRDRICACMQTIARARAPSSRAAAKAPRACFEVRGFDHFAGRRATSRGFEPPSLQTRGTLDLEHKELRTLLSSDVENTGKASGRQHGRRHATSLEQRIRRHRRSKLHVRIKRLRVGPSRQNSASQLCDRFERRRSEDRTFVVRTAPSGEMPMQSVNVPPRSIQNCHWQRPSSRNPSFGRLESLDVSAESPHRMG